MYRQDNFRESVMHLEPNSVLIYTIYSAINLTGATQDVRLFKIWLIIKELMKVVNKKRSSLRTICNDLW